MAAMSMKVTAQTGGYITVETELGETLILLPEDMPQFISELNKAWSEIRPKPKPVFEILCNECGARKSYTLGRLAWQAGEMHEKQTGHEDQLISSPENGWTRYKPLNYEGGTVN